jgi:hypothetical protein
MRITFEGTQPAINAIEIVFGGSSPPEIALTKIARRSVDLSRDIINTLNSIRVQGSWSKLRILKVSLKSAIKAGEIKSLKERL